MTTDPEEHRAIEAAQNLERSVNGLRDEINNLRTFGRRSRHLIWGLAVSLIVDTVLSVAIAFLAVAAVDASQQATEATSLANRNRQTQLAACLSGNESRAANRQLWDYVLDLSGQVNPEPTPERTKLLADFKAYLAKVFAPRDCDTTTVTSLPPAPTR